MVGLQGVGVFAEPEFERRGHGGRRGGGRGGAASGECAPVVDGFGVTLGSMAPTACLRMAFPGLRFLADSLLHPGLRTGAPPGLRRNADRQWGLCRALKTSKSRGTRLRWHGLQDHPRGGEVLTRDLDLDQATAACVPRCRPGHRCMAVSHGPGAEGPPGALRYSREHFRRP